MLEEKHTAELMNELQGAESFRQYAEENEDAFLSAGHESNSVCPFCGKSLRAGASYCTHCMRVLSERRVLTEKKKKICSPLRVFLCVFGALLAALAVSFVIRSGREQKRSAVLPAAEEFRELTAGALRAADEEVRTLWAPDTLTKAGAQAGYAVHEGETALSDEPVAAAFSEDGKRLFFALCDIPHEYSHKALQAAKTAFSAVYRRVPENLEELLEQEGAFRTLDAPDEALNTFYTAAGRHLAGNADQGQLSGEGAGSAGALGIEVSLPIRADRDESGIVSHVYRVTREKTFDLIILFETETF